MRAGSNPLITSSPITTVGVTRLLYVSTSSRTALKLSLTSRSSNSIPLSER
jgi:hypothetical protein